MAELNKLARFAVEVNGDQFTIHVEDASGGKLDLDATREQVDVIVETLDDLLSQDDAADEVD